MPSRAANFSGFHLPSNLKAGRLHLVPEAPEFERTAFLARSPRLANDIVEADWFEDAVAELKRLGSLFADLDLKSCGFPDVDYSLKDQEIRIINSE